MVDLEDSQDEFQHQAHRAVYIFDPEGDVAGEKPRPTKRRKTSKKDAAPANGGRAGEGGGGDEGGSLFVKLMDGSESQGAVTAREELFAGCWGGMDERIQGILRGANQATLDQVSSFVKEAECQCGRRIPCAFIVTGPNIASQGLLFEQLEESLLASMPSRFVRLRSADATNLKATLRKVVHDITAVAAAADEEEDDVGPAAATGVSGRKYLNYDLEAVRDFVEGQEPQERCGHVFVAFEDSEGFDSLLLSDLLLLFSEWRPQIPFTLLFGVATSVELLQARILKSTCEHLYGAQFDVVQGATVLERVMKAAVSAYDVPLRIGPSLLKSLISRQEDQVAGIQVFISSLKYAYMCHFYANPLSIFMAESLDAHLVQPDHLEGIRSLSSFRTHVEDEVRKGNHEHARCLLEDDAYLCDKIRSAMETKNEWISHLLRSLQILSALGVKGSYVPLFIDAKAQGVDHSAEKSGQPMLETLKKMNAEAIIPIMKSIYQILRNGDKEVHLAPGSEDPSAPSTLKRLIHDGEALLAKAAEHGATLRSKYSSQTKLLRTTVIAQKVQLSHDSAALTEEDKAFTVLLDELVAVLQGETCLPAASSLFLHEIWLYDAKAPYRAVFVPRPRGVFERSLTRPQDYLACSCCTGNGDGLSRKAPATSVLYHLYKEGGSLVNVADLWTAFHGIVGDDDNDDEDYDDDEAERMVLMQFYRGLAELKLLGFVKASKKKTDHITKLKWL